MQPAPSARKCVRATTGFGFASHGWSANGASFPYHITKRTKVNEDYFQHSTESRCEELLGLESFGNSEDINDPTSFMKGYRLALLSAWRNQLRSELRCQSCLPVMCHHWLVQNTTVLVIQSSRQHFTSATSLHNNILRRLPMVTGNDFSIPQGWSHVSPSPSLSSKRIWLWRCTCNASAFLVT